MSIKRVREMSHDGTLMISVWVEIIMRICCYRQTNYCRLSERGHDDVVHGGLDGREGRVSRHARHAGLSLRQLRLRLQHAARQTVTTTTPTTL